MSPSTSAVPAAGSSVPHAHVGCVWRVPAGLPASFKRDGGFGRGVGEPRQRLRPAVGAQHGRVTTRQRAIGLAKVADCVGRAMCMGELANRPAFQGCPLRHCHLARQMAGGEWPSQHVRGAQVTLVTSEPHFQFTNSERVVSGMNQLLSSLL